MDISIHDTVAIPVQVAPGGTCVGFIAQMTSDGRIWVDFPGNVGGLVQARIATVPGTQFESAMPVLLVFDNQDPTRPIIVGVVRDTIDTTSPQACAPPAEATIDGRRVVLEGQDEVVLRCGHASITLRKDGKIAIRGVELLSRATGTNRIRGGSVAVN